MLHVASPQVTETLPVLHHAFFPDIRTFANCHRHPWRPGSCNWSNGTDSIGISSRALSPTSWSGPHPCTAPFHLSPPKGNASKWVNCDVQVCYTQIPILQWLRLKNQKIWVYLSHQMCASLPWATLLVCRSFLPLPGVRRVVKCENL